MRLESSHIVINWFELRLERTAAAYAPSIRLLAGLRIAFGVWMVCFPVDVMWIAQVPAGFFHARPGLFSLMTGPPPHAFLAGLTIATALLGALLAVGIFTLPVSVVLSAALITSSGLSYSYSKVDHFILFELTPIFLAFAGWGSVWSLDAMLRRRRQSEYTAKSRGMPVLMFAMTVGWAMLSAALPKIAGGWLDPTRLATRGYLARDIIRGEKLGPLAGWALNIHSDFFWKALDYATIIAEGGLIFAVLFPLAFRLWLTLLAAFHVSVYLTLGINFIDYAFVYTVFFSPVLGWLGAIFNGHRVLAAPEPSPSKVVAE
ncbi:hypothetical protein [Mycolicibacterium mengxianglii]|uniref:hypothetical protein n=1 Tax=Mycolicibacterium mengxianglii TaxID=2736649 RepID=UPI0018D09925|nr:hypothetical protein [Mycolicibacterium mengxianglii]